MMQHSSATEVQGEPGALSRLAERCEAASGPDLDLSHDIGRALVGHSGYTYQPYTASIDAALTLVPEGFYDWELADLLEQALKRWFRMHDDESADSKRIALFICAAALRARAA